MEKNFDFKSIGKRMPYRMPENFLHELESSVIAEIESGEEKEKNKTSIELPRVYSLFRNLIAAAAVATLFIVCYNTMPAKQQSSYADIDRTFDNLSHDDQSFMIDTYENDSFAYIEDSNSY